MIRPSYDVAVIGAGPAGSLAALRCARAGASVLLVDKQRFPRTKVCGCCLNGAALAALENAGLGGLPLRLNAQRINMLRLAAGRARAELPLVAGCAVSRTALDIAMVRAAVDAGAEFIDGTSAQPGGVRDDHRTVLLGGETLSAGCVIVATGLAAGPGGLRESSSYGGNRIGLSTLLDAQREYRAGVHMACGPRGYVGLVTLEDGRLDVAAAVDPSFVRVSGGPAATVRKILESCHMPSLCGLADARWRGTPLLTRQACRVAHERLLIVGDAAGYVEPFTGEGIAWALAGGWSAGELALRPWTASTTREWSRRIARLRRRQGTCRSVAALLRRPLLMRCAVRALSILPRLGESIVRGLNRPIRMDTAAGMP